MTVDDTGRAAKERVSGELTLEKAVGTGAVHSRNHARTPISSVDPAVLVVAIHYCVFDV